MRRVLGIAALTLALATIVVPAAMLYVVWAALVLATAAAFAGSRVFALGATLIGLANLALLNPTLWSALVWEVSNRSVWLKTITSVLFLSLVAALILSLAREGERAAAPKRRTEAAKQEGKPGPQLR